jgi:predicted MFS family arabinose efflux permease
LGGLAVPTVAIPFGWEWVFLIGGVLAALAALFIPFHPSNYEVEPAIAAGQGASRRPSTALPLLVVLAVGAAFGIMGIDALATFVVLYAVDIGFSAAAAGALLAVGSMAGISMRLFAGWQMDRRAAGGLPTVSVFLLLGAVGLGLIASGGPLFVVLGAFTGFAFGWGWSGLFTYSVVRANPLAPAASTGITMTGVFVGAAVGPPLFGLLADGISFTVAWATMAVALVAAATLMRFAARRMPN